MERDTPHVVGRHVLRHAHGHERVHHADEQVLLPGVGKELHIAGTTVVADHREAGDLAPHAGLVLEVHEAPVHLVRLARLGVEALPAAALRRRRLALRRHQGHVRPDVVLDRGEATFVAVCDEALVDDRRVGHPLREQLVGNSLVAGHLCDPGLPARVGVGPDLEAVLLNGPEPRPGQAGPPAQLGEVHVRQVDRVPSVLGHVRKGLVYNILQVIALVESALHSPPHTGASAKPV